MARININLDPSMNQTPRNRRNNNLYAFEQIINAAPYEYANPSEPTTPTYKNSNIDSEYKINAPSKTNSSNIQKEEPSVSSFCEFD